jgi:cell division protein FtsN
MGLVAVAVVALGVLGVYSFASPKAKEAAAMTPATSATGAVTDAVPGVSDLPALSTAAPAPTTTATPVVKVPVTVLNATDINGLAASISGVIKAGGWQTTRVGAYTSKDVAASTVYFTQGNEAQRRAATALVEQFPQLHGPAPRFFAVPGNAAPGLVVVATGEWKP